MQRLQSHLIFRCVSRIAFIPPATPVLRTRPPSGLDWLHEVKFDGFRIQLHKAGDAVRLFSRNGKDFTQRFSGICEAVLALPVRAAVIDGELVACDAEGQPDFYALMRRYTHGLVGALIYFASAAAIFVRSRSRSARSSSRRCWQRQTMIASGSRGASTMGQCCLRPPPG